MYEIQVLDSDNQRLLQLMQWDKDVIVQLKEPSIQKAYNVHFANQESTNSYVVKSTYLDGVLKTKIPNVLLTTEYPIFGYVYVDKPDGECRSVYGFRIAVRRRPQPSDYVYVESQDYISITKISDECKAYRDKCAALVATATEQATLASQSANAAKAAQTQVGIDAASAESSRIIVDEKSKAIDLANKEVAANKQAVETIKNNVDLAEQRINVSEQNITAIQSDIAIKANSVHTDAAQVAKDKASVNKTAGVVSNQAVQVAADAAQVASDKGIVIQKVTEASTAETNAQVSAKEAGRAETAAKTSEANAKISEANAKKTADGLLSQVNTATANANKMAEEASKVNISMTQNPTGVTITTIDRNGVSTEAVLNTVTQVKTWRDIATVVRQGNAKKLIQPGDIFTAQRTDPKTGKVYDVPHHVCDITNITTPEGEIKEAVVIQPHKVIPEDVMFDAWEAFYIAKEELPAGTYHVVFAEKWGNYHNAGDAWSFTLSKPVPKGGLLGGFHDTPYSGFGSAKVESFNSLTDTTPIESVVPRNGAEGTKLGDFTFKGNAQLNSIQRCCYGYNNYKESYQRQYLNSSGKGWWKPQNEYDLPPANYKDKYGYMTGWDEEFLGALRPFKSVIGRNNVTDGGGEDVVYDKFVLPSLEQMHIKKQVATEGPVLPYWKAASPDGAEFPWYTNMPELVHLDTNGTARYVRLRSASVDIASYAWLVFPSGYVSYGGDVARSAYCSAPLAVIY